VKALDVAEQVGVARILNADDMLLRVVPDKLNVMTFVYELRAQLTGSSQQHHVLRPPVHHTPQQTQAPANDMSSTTATATDWLSNLCPLTTSERDAVELRSRRTVTDVQPPHSRPVLTESDGVPTDSLVLMTRHQLLNPFDSDSDSETPTSQAHTTSTSTTQTPATHTPACVSSVQQPCTEGSDMASDQSTPTCQSPADVAGASRSRGRRAELRQQARLLLQQARSTVSDVTASDVTDADRQRRLRERARRLIAESRAGAASNSTSYTQVLTVHSRKTSSQLDQRHNQQTADDGDDQQWTGSYAEVEMELLERSLRRLEERAAGVEWSLRRVMNSERRRSSDDAEERLVYEWFALVDERSELVRRIEQLNAVAHEQDLERRFELLSVELRRLMSESRDRDTDSVDRERLLLAELLSIVNERDALVQQQDQQPSETPGHHDTVPGQDAVPGQHTMPAGDGRSRRDSTCLMQ